MAIVDEVASKMDEFPKMKESNATEHFKRIVYPNLLFPEKIEDQVEHNIDDVTNTLKTYQNSMMEAITQNSKDNGKVDATNENNGVDSSADDNNDSKSTQPNNADTSKSVESHVNGSSTNDTKNAENPLPNNGKNKEATDTSKTGNKKAEDVKTEIKDISAKQKNK